MRVQALVVGGGLAGLSTARLLHRAGVEVQLRDARPRLGGRIFTAGASGDAAADGFDLGPSWFWPRMQPSMAALVEELRLASFPQHSEGDLVFHRMSREAVQRYGGVRQEPESMRLVGGTGALVTALAASLPAGCCRPGSRLTHLALLPDDVEARCVSVAGVVETVRASHVVLALPPRLLEATVSFAPAVDPATASRWRRTPTWMAPHAKFFAVYDRAFWRDAGLSGTAQSMVGPLVEIHDATTASGQAALFGFVGIPVVQRQSMTTDDLVAASIRQLVTLFGPDAGTPLATLYKDWAADPLTATALDWTDGAHPAATDREWVDGEWRGRITLAGSETSPTEPGYLAGAVQAAERAAREVLQHLR
ncbi:MAG: flavin monoamine oxidase family protein [Vicinamibacterales bacterium]